MTTAELLSLDTATADLWVIEDFLPIGLTMLSAQPKSGKSRAAIQMSHAVVDGRTFHGYTPPRPQQAMYFALEQGRRSVQAAVRSLGVDRNANIDWRFALPGTGSFQAFLDAIRQAKEAQPDLRLVTVDMWNRLPLPPESVNESGVYRREMKALAPLQALAHELEIAILLLHHTNAPGDRHGGSNAVAGTVDTLWMIERSSGRRSGRWTLSGRDVPDLDFQVAWDPLNGSWVSESGTTTFSTDVTDVLRIEKAVSDLVAPRHWISRPHLIRDVRAAVDPDDTGIPKRSYVERMVDQYAKQQTVDGVFERASGRPVRYRRPQP